MGIVLANHVYSIAGDKVTINRLVAQGSDPHHYEPAPSDVIKLTDDDVLPGEPGDLEHSCINMRVQDIEILTEALDGDGSHADHIETRNIPDAE